MDKCPFCGSEITEVGKFCASCGHQLTDAEPAPQVEAPVEVAEATAETPASVEVPVEAPVAQTEAPVEPPAEVPAAPAQPTAQPPQAPAYGAAQPPMPNYNAPQQPAPGYNMPQQPGYGTMTQTAVKKNKKGMILAIVVGAVVVLGIIAAILVFFKGSSDHSLDGEYKLSALAIGDQDYSSYLGYLEDGYNLIVDGSEVIIESPGYRTVATIDQAKHTISSGEFGTVEFTVDGKDITLNLNSEYTMTFTRQ